MLRNTQHNYGLVSKHLHWLIALLVISLLILGNTMADLSNEDIWYYRCLDLHQTIGIIVWLVMWLTLLWRVVTAPPQTLIQANPWLNRLKWLVHQLLKLALIIQPVLGYLYTTAWGDPLEIYTFLEIPPLTRFSKAESDLLITSHAYLAYSLAAVVVLHSLAALKHHFFNGTKVLRRMWY